MEMCYRKALGKMFEKTHIFQNNFTKVGLKMNIPNFYFIFLIKIVFFKEGFALSEVFFFV